ncbi:DUF2158 domain-containing protein [Hymenobacter sp. GOD-10R]|uniref:DUF2158 domain-containing protein n=1 Tax=Hymenobacter sp. GOD-10R TaxID=3093922 RepID=UPI002D7A2605|nr:DUF2158 domain-containing protein [Hymenobacter sp. GOD-10R]WRQ26254.1 DUF2158 domain-containing protein [Hymenobacter sp. GOD-10R]
MPLFKTGDVVHLASGGPSMTVITADQEVVHCTYFDQEGNLYGNPDGIPFQSELLRAGNAPTPDENEERENSKFGYA